MRRSFLLRSLVAVSCCVLVLRPLSAQQQRHGRGYKPPPPTATVVVTVEKSFNSKPMPNASVIFHAVHEEETTANLEMKTDPDGRASIDLLEVGSHVTVQVFADGFATYATDFDLSPNGKEILVKLQRPRAQVSTYEDNANRPAATQPGVQEHRPGASPSPAPPPTSSPTAPLQTTPPAETPGSSPAPSAAGSPR